MDPVAFKATLPNGKSVSGMSGHLVARVDYESRNVDEMIAQAETVAASYTKAKPILSQRIPQLRARVVRNVPPEQEAVVVAPSKPPAPVAPDAAVPPAAAGPPGKSPVEVFNDVHADEAARLAAISEMAMSPAPEHMDLFVRASGDPSPRIRKWALSGISRFKTPEALAKLVSMEQKPGLDPDSRAEIIKQFGRFGSSSNEELSLAALQELTRVLTSSDSNEALKTAATNQLAACAESGNPWVRPYLEKLQIGGLEEVRAIWSAADAQKARNERRQRAFTPEDRAVFREFIHGIPAVPATPVRKGSEAVEGRLARITKEYEEKKGKAAVGGLIGAFFDDPKRIAKNLASEIAVFKEGDLRKIGIFEMDRLFYLNFEIGSQRKGLDIIDSAAKAAITADPVRAVSEDQWGRRIEYDSYTPNIVNGTAAVAVHALAESKLRPRVKDAIEIEEFFKRLSPSAKEVLAEHYAYMVAEQRKFEEKQRQGR